MQIYRLVRFELNFERPLANIVSSFTQIFLDRVVPINSNTRIVKASSKRLKLVLLPKSKTDPYLMQFYNLTFRRSKSSCGRCW